MENSEELFLSFSPRWTSLQSCFSKENPTRMRNHLHWLSIYLLFLLPSLSPPSPMPGTVLLKKITQKSLLQGLFLETQLRVRSACRHDQDRDQNCVMKHFQHGCGPRIAEESQTHCSVWSCLHSSHGNPSRNSPSLSNNNNRRLQSSFPNTQMLCANGVLQIATER